MNINLLVLLFLWELLFLSCPSDVLWLITDNLTGLVSVSAVDTQSALHQTYCWRSNNIYTENNIVILTCHYNNSEFLPLNNSLYNYI